MGPQPQIKSYRLIRNAESRRKGYLWGRILKWLSDIRWSTPTTDLSNVKQTGQVVFIFLGTHTDSHPNKEIESIHLRETK